MPTADPAFLLWLENFAAKFSLASTTLGLTSDLAPVLADLNFTRFVINNTEGQRQRLGDNVSIKNQLLNGPLGLAALGYPGPATLTGLTPPPPGAPPGTLGTAPAPVAAGVIPRLTAIVGRITAAATYNDGIGQDLGIIAPGAGALDLSALKPEIAVSHSAMKVLIAWTKERGTDGLRIEADYATGAFVHVIDDPRPDHLDTHPLPASGAAVWRYRAIYVRDGQPVGSVSDVSSIAVSA